MTLASSMKTNPVKLPFSVADTTAGPVLRWENDRLTVEFSDYLQATRRIAFNDVCHFEWIVEDELDPTISPYDGVVEVLDSPVLARLTEIGEISPDKENAHRHWVIGFNEVAAYLVVIFRDFDLMECESSLERKTS